MRARENQLTRNQQKRLVEITAVIAFTLLITVLAAINFQNEIEDLKKENELLTQENLSLSNEIIKKDAEIETLKWNLEEEKK
jgi:hypothetical protein